LLTNSEGRGNWRGGSVRAKKVGKRGKKENKKISTGSLLVGRDDN